MNRYSQTQPTHTAVRHKLSMRSRSVLNIALALLFLVGFLQPHLAQAAPLLLIVDRFDDDPSATACTGINPSDCSLRGAIIAANANLGPDTITLPAGTYLLDEVGTGEGAALDGDLDIMGDLTINGVNQATTIIDGNGAVTGEHVFTIDGSYSAEMNDLTITGGSGNPVGGITAFGGLTLTNVTVNNNHGTGSGGGIQSVTSLTLLNSTISNNTADNGAGVFVFGGTVAITSTTLSGNIATGLGGAIFQNLGTITIESTSEVTLNQASGGGGIATNGGTLTVNDSSIHQNQVTTNGGGIYIGSSGSVTLTNTNVNQNTSVGSGTTGGGIQSYGALEMNGGQLSLNTTASDGGGLMMYDASAIVNIYDATIDGNHTTEDDSYGGGIANYFNGQLTLTGTTVSNNYMDGTVSSSTYGGGVFSDGGDLTLTDSLILNNDAIDSGGGVYFSNGTLTITNSIFRGNEVSGTNSSGGGLFNGSFSVATVKQTEFSGNISANISGGIHTQGTLTLENATLSGNSATNYGAGIMSTGSDKTIILNSTIYGNIVPSGSSAGGLVAYNDVTVKNTIVASNDNDECLNSTGITSDGYNISGDNTCGFSAGGDQPNTDPLLGALAANGGFTKTHALQATSPAIDTGTNTGCPATDQRGLSRPQDGDDNSTDVCDIGAYERVGITFSDVGRGHWAFGFIEALAEAGLTAGYPDGTYRPANQVTRAEMAVFLLKGIHGASYTPPTPDGSHPFSDIGSHWAEAWIEQLYDEGLTAGYPDNTYRPFNNITRAEMAVMLLRAKHGGGYSPPTANGSHPFSDIGGHWANAWIEQLYDEGITAGYPDGTFRPFNNVTRAEMAVFLVNTFSLTVY